VTHPTPESLATFIDGSADAATRAEVTEHIETCDDCLMIVGETARLMDEEGAHVSPRRYAPWLLLAAAIAGIVFGVGWWIYDRDPVAKLVRASRTLEHRPVQARLADFDHWQPPLAVRGVEGETERRLLRVRGVAGDVLESNEDATDDARKQHAAGVAALIAGNTARAISLLERATRLAPTNPAYWNDLAAAHVEAYATKADATQLVEALPAIDRALQLDAGNLAALFNRARILAELHERPQAIAAYERYLSKDTTSQWAEDARQQMDLLRQSGGASSWEEDKARLETAARRWRNGAGGRRSLPIRRARRGRIAISQSMGSETRCRRAADRHGDWQSDTGPQRRGDARRRDCGNRPRARPACA
jgi:tetratricopeptide (TPR) repeat protein